MRKANKDYERKTVERHSNTRNEKSHKRKQNLK